jgi:hypothetical protein
VARTLLCLFLAILALPAAAASAGALSPPAPAGGGVAAAAVSATAGPGCSSTNVIEFRDRTVIPIARRYAVRHTGRIRCDVPMTIRCHATLFQGEERISEIGSRSRDRCEIASSFGASDSYPPGTWFRQRYRYKLTLRRERQHWAGTSRFCAKLSDNRRTLTCHDSHVTSAPRRHVDSHS